jgi:D-glycero-D-manno-heptose 1,7-bisphosphate phosphatase
MPIKTIFLDRDGVINKEVNYLHRIEDFAFIDGIFEACNHFLKLGYKIIIVTNQSGIARGYFKENDYHNLSNWMLKQFQKKSIDILDIFYCPHGPESNCNCRKPNPGMFFKAQDKHGIDMKNSWLIGDKEDDIIAGISSGILNTILVRSGHKINERSTKAKFIINSIKDSNNIINN